MSEHDLYEIARHRIDQRNRRWTIWGVDLAVLILAGAAIVLLSETAYVTVAVAAFMVWAGVFTLHTIVAALAQSRENDIDGEVAKLREAVSDTEKPKRLALADDGELVEVEDWHSNGGQSGRLTS